MYDDRKKEIFFHFFDIRVYTLHMEGMNINSVE